MYQHILIPLDHSPTDDVGLNHFCALARHTGARLTLVHVADGHGARNLSQLSLAPTPEMVADRDYLAQQQKRLTAEGFQVDAHLAWGDPAQEILQLAESTQCDLIAMATHGHGKLADLVLGSVADQIRHRTDIPVLLIRKPKVTPISAAKAPPK